MTLFTCYSIKYAIVVASSVTKDVNNYDFTFGCNYSLRPNFDYKFSTVMKKSIAIGCDHAGYELKEKVIKHLEGRGYDVTDFGTNSEESVDYPDFGHKVADAVQADENMIGIVICGSANGINMTVNKHQGIRSAIAWTPKIAELARQHNNANILALPARFISTESAMEMVDVFLGTEFEGGRHVRRVNKIPCC